MDLQDLVPVQDYEAKWMRFQAAQVDKICGKLEKLNDTLSMLIRASEITHMLEDLQILWSVTAD